VEFSVENNRPPTASVAVTAMEDTISRPAESDRLWLCGDVMTGRGIDQILPFPGHPALHESHVSDARDYVALAAGRNGAVPQPVSFEYPWGDAIDAVAALEPDLRIANLETAITRSADHWPGKAVHYRMHPANVPCLRAFQLGCCTLANNHVLDWGYRGLQETLESLAEADIPVAGAGVDAESASCPAELPLADGRRVLVFSLGIINSGIPRAWAAAADKPGVALLTDVSPAGADIIVNDVRTYRSTGDVVVVSLHWGGNWGYEVPAEHRNFAHMLIDSGCVDIVHGHSSHHPMSVEVYRDRPILFGCGDFINDYEGIGGYEAFRPDIVLGYSVDLDQATGALNQLAMLPLQLRRLQLGMLDAGDMDWICSRMGRLCDAYGARVEQAGRLLMLRW
jgi:poly-gamma-glutamate capsule biosynthesis protein CapA/YwtB (metallophosphatase superfamily)